MRLIALRAVMEALGPDRITTASLNRLMDQRDMDVDALRFVLRAMTPRVALTTAEAPLRMYYYSDSYPNPVHTALRLHYVRTTCREHGVTLRSLTATLHVCARCARPQDEAVQGRLSPEPVCS